MTTLQDFQKAAKNAAKKKQQQEEKTKKASTNTTNKATQITKQQQDAMEQMQKNIQNQGILKGTITTAKQGAENKVQQTFLSGMSAKQKDGYDYLRNLGYSETEARKAVKDVMPKTVSNWTATQQNDYDYLVNNGYSEKQAKNIIQDIRYNQIYNEQLQSNLDSGMKEGKAERKANKAAQKDIQTDWSTGKKVWTGVKSFGQGVADVGQRTVGRAIDWAAGKVVDWTGLDDKYGEYTPQNQTSILSDEQEKSRIGTVGRKTGEIAGATALSMAAGGVAGGGAKAIGTAAGSKAVGGIAGTVLGAGEGALSADIYARGVEDRAATNKERAVGAALGGVFGGISGYRQTAKALSSGGQKQIQENIAKSKQVIAENEAAKKTEDAVKKYTVDESKKLTKGEKKIAEMIQDTSTKGKKQAIKGGRTKLSGGLFNKEQVQELSQSEKNAAKFIKKGKLYSSDPQKMYNNIDDAISKTANEMSDKMKNIKIDNTAKNEIKQYVEALGEMSDQNKIPSWKKDLSVITNKIDNADNANDLWDIRKVYDSLFTDNQKLNLDGHYDGINKLWREGRGVLTKAMNKAADDAGDKATEAGMKYLSSMINARETLGANMLKQVGKKVPTKLKKIATGAGIGGGLTVAWSKGKSRLRKLKN